MTVQVGKEQKNCDPTDPADAHRGDYGDHVAYGPEHRPALAVIPGARTRENAEAITAAVKQRIGGKGPALITTDEAPVYQAAIDHLQRAGPTRTEARPGSPSDRAPAPLARAPE